MVHPNALTIDIAKSQLYWGDTFLNVLERVDYDGKNRVLIAKGDDVSHTFIIIYFHSCLCILFLFEKKTSII